MSEGLNRLRRIFADHAGSESALHSLRLTMGERAPALAWTAWRAGLIEASDAASWPLMAEAKSILGEDVREFIFAWAVAQEAGSWSWDASLDAVLDAAGDFGPLLDGLDRLPEPGRTQLACALARLGWLDPATLPEHALRVAARAFVSAWTPNLVEVSGLWPPAVWAAAVRTAAVDVGRVSSPERVRPLLVDAPPREVAAVVRCGGWPQLGIWAAADRGPVLAGAFFVELGEVDPRAQFGGALGLLLGLARFGPLPARFDSLLRDFVVHIWAPEIQSALLDAVSALPLSRREALLTRNLASMPWALLHACPSARVREDAVRAIVEYPSSGASYSTDIVADALVALKAREEILAVILSPLAPRARQVLVNALVRMATHEDRKLLASLVEDPDVEVRGRARWGLEQLGIRTVTEPADAAVRAYLEAVGHPGGYGNPYLLYGELEAQGQVRRFAEVLLDAPPTRLLDAELAMLRHRPGQAEVADAVARRLCADHLHGPALYDWLAEQPELSSARRKAFQRGLADRRPLVVSICRAALRAAGEDPGSGPVWSFEQTLPDGAVERFEPLAAAVAEIGRLGRFTMALWRTGMRPKLVVSGINPLEEEFVVAAHNLGAIRPDPGATALEQLGRLTRALEPLHFHPLDGPLIEALPADSVDIAPCTRQEAEEIIHVGVRMDAVQSLHTRNRALIAGFLDNVQTLGLDFFRTDRRIVQGYYDGGVFFASADYRVMGLIWYDNDQ